ncbi:Nuclear transcription factor Y subunit C-1 [Platanthera guangdongensis]|uniref:Nuclear transcription factor Y subunit C-1 n=1 Tax=Platanthera guangdongensis TaxID=2320717 RepID=A0ABR2LPI2_9ASPA
MRRPGVYSGMFTGGKASGRKGSHSLPLTRIKKIMKNHGGGDVSAAKMMISVEAPIVLSKVCELFIEELTRRSWAAAAAVHNKRKTLLHQDVAAAVKDTDNFDFLVPMVSSGGSGRTRPGPAEEDSDGVVSYL